MIAGAQAEPTCDHEEAGEDDARRLDGTGVADDPVRGQSVRSMTRMRVNSTYAGGLVAALFVCGCRTGDGAAGVNATSADRPAAGLGEVSGRVVYAGPLPAQTTRYVAQLDRTIDEHTVHVDPATGGLREAVVFLRPHAARPGEAPVVKPGSAEQPALDQLGGVFRPHVLAVRAGQPVRFTISDPGLDNIHAVSLVGANMFNQYLEPGMVYDHTFQMTPRDFPVLLVCELHDWMKGWVYVFDHPYYALTNEDGRFAIEGVLPDTYTLVAHHADGRLRLEQPITITAGQRHDLTLTLEGKPGG